MDEAGFKDGGAHVRSFNLSAFKLFLSSKLHSGVKYTTFMELISTLAYTSGRKLRLRGGGGIAGSRVSARLLGGLAPSAARGRGRLPGACSESELGCAWLPSVFHNVRPFQGQGLLFWNRYIFLSHLTCARTML